MRRRTQQVFGLDVLLDAVGAAVEAALAPAGEVQHRLAQGFRGDGAGMHRHAADPPALFDHQHRAAELGGLDRGPPPGRAAADDDEVVPGHAALPSTSCLSLSGIGEICPCKFAASARCRITRPAARAAPPRACRRPARRARRRSARPGRRGSPPRRAAGMRSVSQCAVVAPSTVAPRARITSATPPASSARAAGRG